MNKGSRIPITERYVLALFMSVRNQQVLPIGLQLGKSMEEINRMSYATMIEIIQGDILDWEKVREHYREGRNKFLEGTQ